MTRTPDRTFQAAARDALVAEVENTERPGEARLETAGPAPRSVVRVGIAILIAGGTIAAAWLGIIAVRDHRLSAAPPAATHHAVSPTPSAPPSAAVGLSDDRMSALISQVTGSGTLAGPITGRFTITYPYGSPVLRLRDLQVGSSTARTVLVAVDLASATCRASEVGTTAGTITAQARQSADLQDSSPQRFSDLSYMRALAIWPNDMGCVAAKVSAGTIDWTLPAALRAIAQTDRGPRHAAQGKTIVDHGRPARYTVAADDRIASVAARFDLSTDELLYLNPLRDHGSDVQLYVGETLNLNPLDRAYFSNTGF